jgi:hypothetical protein
LHRIRIDFLLAASDIGIRAVNRSVDRKINRQVLAVERQ